MGFRFQRRIALFPGVRLNFSARGISATVGVPGASMNFGPNGPTLNLGIPGTGLSFRQHLGNGARPQPEPALPTVPFLPTIPVPAPTDAPGSNAVVIQSAPVAQVTSDGLQTLKEMILKVRGERDELNRAISAARVELERAQRRLRRAQNWFFGLFLKKKVPERTAAVESKASALQELETRLEGTFVDAEMALDEATLAVFGKLVEAFTDLAGCARIWDVTSTRENDRYATRSSASTSVDRRQVRFAIADGDEVLQTSAKSLRLQNANGADLDIYPGFVLLRERADIALIDLRDVMVEFSEARFVESDPVPPDGAVIGKVWAKSNRDGSPDRRFRDNYQIPLVRYGEVQLRSSRGLNESYMFSSYDKSKRFAQAFSDYQSALRAFAETSPPLPETRERPAWAARDDRAAAAPDAACPYTMKALDFIKARSAISLDDAVRTMTTFAELLKSDMESMNGQNRQVSDFRQFVTDIGRMSSGVRGFFSRSPAAKALEPVAVRETNKMVQGVFDQLERALLTKADAEDVQSLLGHLREAGAALRDAGRGES